MKPVLSHAFLNDQILREAQEFSEFPFGWGNGHTGSFVKRTGFYATDYLNKSNDPQYGQQWVAQKVHAYLQLQPIPQLAELKAQLAACQTCIPEELAQGLLKALELCAKLTNDLEPSLCNFVYDGADEMRVLLALIAALKVKVSQVAGKTQPPEAMQELIASILACFNEVDRPLREAIAARDSVPLRDSLVFQNYEYLQDKGAGSPPMAYIIDSLKRVQRRINETMDDSLQKLEEIHRGSHAFFKQGQYPKCVWIVTTCTDAFDCICDGEVVPVEVTSYGIAAGTGLDSVIPSLLCEDADEGQFRCKVEDVFMSEDGAQQVLAAKLKMARLESAQADLACLSQSFLPQIISALELSTASESETA